MSKFQSTISVVAGLGSIFGVAVAAHKLSQESQVKQVDTQSQAYEERIIELERKLEEATTKELVSPEIKIVELPKPQQQTDKPPKPPELLPIPPQPEPQPNTFE